ncbi:thioredoxin family protein [Microbacterium sp. DT81.1]|uniref:thioredoxin family protein n=1 Tax=Microbacterium sp. DT81.1 TaxID=3393413 RepID=UPI003CF2C627
MKIELLHIDDCPSWVEAGNRLQDALTAAGLGDTKITYRILGTAGVATDVRFAGSPTILVNGEDLFPSTQRTFDLACRVYQTALGLAGTPTTEQFDALVSRGQ